MFSLRARVCVCVYIERHSRSRIFTIQSHVIWRFAPVKTTSTMYIHVCIFRNHCAQIYIIICCNCKKFMFVGPAKIVQTLYNGSHFKFKYSQICTRSFSKASSNFECRFDDDNRVVKRKHFLRTIFFFAI